MEIPKSFLMDEVRCGFVVPGAIKQAWCADLEVLAEIDRVCEKHHIEYFADWGTLLGAIRHGGFVPWDDDIDIVMKRADYEKFLQVASKDMAEGFHVQTTYNQKDFWLFMAKVVGRNHFCFEKEHLRKFHNFPYIASVDIFVLDYVYRDPEKEEHRRKVCKYLLGVADAIVEGYLRGAKKERSLQTAEELYGQTLRRISDPVEMGRYLYGVVERLFAEVPEEEADKLVQLFPWGLKGDGSHIAKDYYEECIRVPFECTTMPVPKRYDSMLRKRYGDYMKLVKNAGAHDYPFFEGQKKNLLKVLDTPLPEFRFDRNMLYRSTEELSSQENSLKSLLSVCETELWKQLERLAQVETVEEAVTIIQNSQQLAIDMGTLMESVKGEGTVAVTALEQYCEGLYEMYQSLTEGNTEIGVYEKILWEQREVIEDYLQELQKRKSVVFIASLAKDWKAYEMLYREACAKVDTDVYVVVVPYFVKDFDGSAKEICYEGEKFEEWVKVSDYKQFTPEYLELLHPEEIYIQNPYDEWNPLLSIAQGYYAKNLRRYTEKLIYVAPYRAEDFGKEQYRQCHNLKYYVTMPGIVYADQVIVPSEEIRLRYIEKLMEFAGESTVTVWEEKVQARNVFALLHIDDETKKRLLYGIGLGSWLEDECMAQEKYMQNLAIFDENRDRILVDYYRYPEGIMPDITKYDAYYGDPSPVVVEFMTAEKPVMIQNYSGS